MEVSETGNPKFQLIFPERKKGKRMKNKNMRRFCRDSWQCLQCYLQFYLNTVLCGRCSARRATVIRRGKNELDADEVVKAKDLELETGSIFEVEKDFTGLEIPDEKR